MFHDAATPAQGRRIQIQVDTAPYHIAYTHLSIYVPTHLSIAICTFGSAQCIFIPLFTNNPQEPQLARSPSIILYLVCTYYTQQNSTQMNVPFLIHR